MPTATAPPPAGRADLAALGLARKTFACEFKTTDEAAGSFECYAAVFGNVDRQGDVIEPGAFTNLDEFTLDGFGLFNHQVYSSLPVALVDTATQDGHGLNITGRWHTHPEAQACRTVVKERMAAGKSVKCSIGYVCSDEVYEKVNGQNVRRIKALQVYEFSFVNIAANPSAAVTSAKSATASLPTEVPMSQTIAEKGAAALAALKEWLGGLETKGDKAMSKAGMTRLKAFAEAMDEHGGATREHAKAMHEHGKAACAMGKEMKAFLKDYASADPDSDGDAEGDYDSDGDGDETEVTVKPSGGKKPKKEKAAKPEDTADGDPPKGKGKKSADPVLDTYRDQLRHRALTGRRQQSAP